MIQNSPTMPPDKAEDFWEELLPNIEKRQVIPILGPDLLKVKAEENTVLLDRYIASQLAIRFAPRLDDLPAEPSLSVVVGQLARRGVRIQTIYPAVHAILARVRIPQNQDNGVNSFFWSADTWKALKQLAEITHFNLFVTTHIDSLLEDAINAVSFGRQNGTESIVYGPRAIAPLFAHSVGIMA